MCAVDKGTAEAMVRRKWAQPSFLVQVEADVDGACRKPPSRSLPEYLRPEVRFPAEAAPTEGR